MSSFVEVRTYSNVVCCCLLLEFVWGPVLRFHWFQSFDIVLTQERTDEKVGELCFGFCKLE